MNEIETLFYNEICNYVSKEDYEIQPIIGIYKPDFLLYKHYIIEIDGHEYHKTKEQREKDYKRERYLLKKGYLVIRFMATEVYLNANKCFLEVVDEIIPKFMLIEFGYRDNI